MVQLDTLVHLLVHVYGQVGDEQEVAVEVHEPAFHARFGSDQDPSGKRERAIQPGGIDHAAVSFDIEGQIAPAPLQGGDVLHLECGRIGMRGCNLEAYGGVGPHCFGEPECDDGRTVARGEVAPAWFELPGILFPKEGKAVFPQAFRDVFDRMEGAGALLDEAGQVGIDIIENT